MARVTCHLSCVLYHVSRFTCHMSLMPTATFMDPPPANSHTMHCRMVCKGKLNSQIVGLYDSGTLGLLGSKIV